MLKTTNLQFQHSTHFEIDAIDLTIEKGEIISLIGPNGSGKSTFLRFIGRAVDSLN